MKLVLGLLSGLLLASPVYAEPVQVSGIVPVCKDVNDMVSLAKLRTTEGLDKTKALYDSLRDAEKCTAVPVNTEVDADKLGEYTGKGVTITIYSTKLEDGTDLYFATLVKNDDTAS